MSDTVEPDYVEGLGISSGNGGGYGLNTPSAGDLENGFASGPLNGGENLGASVRGTLDEPVSATLKRDIYEINGRLKQVVYPHFPFGAGVAAEESEITASADLWAPLCFTILYALALSFGRTLFSSLFVLSWASMLAMGLHLRATKPHAAVSLMSYVSGTGYCLFPQVINAVFSSVLFPLFVHVFPAVSWRLRILVLLRIITFVLCSAWSYKAACVVTCSNTSVERYPLALFLVGLGWLCVVL
ncbi:LAFE_0D04698g1_1 [Lachancea fermentati]|uniref:LAFE_0D04698g1_1 n=1 Tax=Lachancea fermentati TaxID=4955 RepID=A0A1G4MBG4_LACFM|nr:LAFE_0D04698g1_1 [Lachancea fermentati]